STVVLFTDGVIEARRDGELYGEERLERLLASRRALAAQELAEAILADCRAFAGGELGDDCAVVCLKLAR
ncbi:MAG: SpoIIE family protein phosphatase, partial [Gaiellaceae bacterium]